MKLVYVLLLIIAIAIVFELYNRFELIWSAECPECKTIEHLTAMIRCSKCGRIL